MGREPSSSLVFPCLQMIAVILAVPAAVIGLGLISQRGSYVWGELIFLALILSLAIYNYRTFPARKISRTLVRLFEIIVVLLSLFVLLASIFLRDGSWGWLMFLLFFLNLPITSRITYWQRTTVETSPAFYRRQEQRLQRAMHYVGEHGVITIPVYYQLTGVPEETARSDLEVLVRRGALRATGDSQTRQYRFP